MLGGAGGARAAAHQHHGTKRKLPRRDAKHYDEADAHRKGRHTEDEGREEAIGILICRVGALAVARNQKVP